MKNIAGKLSNGNEKDYPNRWSSGTNTSSHRPPFPFQLMTCLWCSSLSSIRLSFAGSELQLGLRTWVNRQDMSCGVLFQAGIEGVDWVGVVALNLFEIKMEILKCKLLFEKLSPIWIFFLSFGTAPACFIVVVMICCHCSCCCCWRWWWCCGVLYFSFGFLSYFVFVMKIRRFANIY